MEKEYINGLIKESMTVIGLMENNMGKENTLTKRELKKKVSGLMAKEKNGLMKRMNDFNIIINWINVLDKWIFNYNI